MDPALVISTHAHRRSSSRRIPEEAITAAIRWGRRYWTHGDLAWRLDRRSVEAARRCGVRVDDYEGVTVIVATGGVVRTVWCNRTPRRIRR